MVSDGGLFDQKSCLFTWKIPSPIGARERKSAAGRACSAQHRSTTTADEPVKLGTGEPLTPISPRHLDARNLGGRATMENDSIIEAMEPWKFRWPNEGTARSTLHVACPWVVPVAQPRPYKGQAMSGAGPISC